MYYQQGTAHWNSWIDQSGLCKIHYQTLARVLWAYSFGHFIQEAREISIVRSQHFFSQL